MKTLLNELELLEFIRQLYSSMVEVHTSDTTEETARKQMELKDLEKRGRKCRSQIIQRVVDSHLEYVKDCDSAHSIWTLLNDTLERKSIAS